MVIDDNDQVNRSFYRWLLLALSSIFAISYWIGTSLPPLFGPTPAPVIVIVVVSPPG